MDRDYAVQVKDTEAVTYFIGTEVEHTPAYGVRTLFVVGLQSGQEVLQMAKRNNVGHIYLGANQSMTPASVTAKMGYWEDLARECLDDKYVVTIDTTQWCIERMTSCWNDEVINHKNLIPIISLRIRDIEGLNKNTVLKIDDYDFDESNPGVWCHSLKALQAPEVFTPWSKYTDDMPVE